MPCFNCCGRDTKVRPFKQDPSEADHTVNFEGPLENRECRDVIFLIIFLVFVGGVGVVTYLGAQHGNPLRLVNGVDSWGNVCDQQNSDIPNVNLSGQNLEGKPKVFFFDQTHFTSLLPDNPFPSFTDDDEVIICIENCPNKDVDVLTYYNNEHVNLCIYGVTPYIDDRKQCPVRTVSKHVSMFNRCVPESIVLLAKTMTSSFASIIGSANIGGDITQKIISDLNNTWREIGYLAAIAVGVALVVVIMMRFLAGVIVWTLVIVVVVLSLGATTYCW